MTLVPNKRSTRAFVEFLGKRLGPKPGWDQR
jgi:hypothetical protein